MVKSRGEFRSGRPVECICGNVGLIALFLTPPPWSRSAGRGVVWLSIGWGITPLKGRLRWGGGNAVG